MGNFALQLPETRAEGREDLDAYYTPDALAEACVAQLIRDGFLTRATERILEPSFGRGAWARAIHKATGKLVDACEFDPKRADEAMEMDCVGDVRCCDFLELDLTKPAPNGDLQPGRYDLAIGNPPYARGTGRFNDKGKEIMEPIAAAHVRKALSISLCTAMLLRLAFVAPKRDRVDLLQGLSAPARIYTLDPRPSFTGGTTDNSDYAFIVWKAGDSSCRTVPLIWGANNRSSPQRADGLQGVNAEPESSRQENTRNKETATCP